MSFPTFEYIFLFLPMSAVVHFALQKCGRQRESKLWLLLTSFVFYSVFSFKIALLLVGWSLLNHRISLLLCEETLLKRKKTVLCFAIAANTGVLFFYRYLPFSQTLLVPLGLSFYLFQQISHLVDSYHGIVKKTGLLDYLLFSSFFPSICAGPLSRSNAFISQLNRPFSKFERVHQQSLGLYRFAIGFFLKTVVTHSLFPLVSVGLDTPGRMSFVTAWLTLFSIPLCIYFDLAGYANMAIGSGLFFGVKLPENFDSPFLSTNISDFWKRWHLTVTRFFFDYVYFPCARQMKNPTHGKLMVLILSTMILIGLWHGFAWTFFIFGLMHGAALVLYHSFKGYSRRFSARLGWGLTHLFVSWSFVFFLSSSISKGFEFTRTLFQLNDVIAFDPCYALAPWRVVLSVLAIGLGSGILFWRPLGDTLSGQHFMPSLKTAIVTVLCALMGILSINSDLTEGFVYFGF